MPTYRYGCSSQRSTLDGTSSEYRLVYDLYNIRYACCDTNDSNASRLKADSDYMNAMSSVEVKIKIILLIN
jgi:hypothetical protein